MSRLPAVALLACLVCGAYQPPDAVYAEAVRLQQSGDCAGAVEQYRLFLQWQPDHPGARSNLGACLAALGQYDAAIAEYRHALKLVPGHTGIRRNLGLAYYKSARMPEAIAELSVVRADHPDDLGLAILLADCYFRLGAEKEVIRILEPMAERYPDNPGLAYLLGTALIRDGEVARGRPFIEKLLSRGKAPEAHLMLGSANLRGANLKEAEAEFSKAAELDPKLPAVWSQLGLTRLRLNDRDGAVEAFRHEIATNPTDYEANFYLGVILRESGKPEEALPFLEQALRLRPASLKARYQIGSLHLQMHQDEKALQVLEAVVTEAPSFSEAHAALATAYYRLGRKEEAARHREIARKLLSETSQGGRDLTAQPPDSKTSVPARDFYEKANSLFMAQKFEECQAALDQALRRDPRLVPALTLQAKLAMALNRLDAARQPLEQALAVDPGSAHAQFLYGFLFHLQNELPRALVELEKARKLNPADSRPTLYLGLTHESLGHTEEAIRLYKEAIRLEEAAGDSRIDSLLVLARLLLVLGRLDECGRLIDRSLSLAPDSRDAHYEHARLLLQKGDATAAATEGEKALALPASGITDRQIRYLLVRAYGLAGREGDAKRHAALLRTPAEPDAAFPPGRARSLIR